MGHSFNFMYLGQVSDAMGEHLYQFCEKSATGTSGFQGTCYGFIRKVLQVEYREQCGNILALQKEKNLNRTHLLRF